MMTNDTYREVVKALAYGENKSKICRVMNVTEADVDGVNKTDIEVERAYLKEMGYINGD